MTKEEVLSAKEVKYLNAMLAFSDWFYDDGCGAAIGYTGRDCYNDNLYEGGGEPPDGCGLVRLIKQEDGTVDVIELEESPGECSSKLIPPELRDTAKYENYTIEV